MGVIPFARKTYRVSFLDGRKENRTGVKWMRKYRIKILCYILSLVLLSGCANGLQNGVGGEAGSTKGSIQGGGKDGIEVNSGRKEAESSSWGADGTKNLQGEFTMAGNYREIGLKNPAGIEERGEVYCGTFLNAEGNVELNTFSPWTETGKEMIFCYTLSGDGTHWNRQPVLWTEGLKGKLQQNRINLFSGEDQVSYAYYCDEEQFYHLVRQEGDSHVEIKIADWANRRGEFLGELSVLACGNIVMTDTVGNCYVYSPDGARILDSFKCGWCETLCVSGNDVFVLDRESGAILHYDGANTEMLSAIEGDFTNIVRLSVHEDVLYACSPDGIFFAGFARAGKAGDGEEPFTEQEKPLFSKWLDAGKFHFSKENGYPLDFFSLGEIFYVVYAESWGRIKKYVPRKESDAFLGTLTVYSLETSELVIDMIGEFMMQYPQIDVYYETGEGAEGATLVSDRIRALNTRILSGDGPDIIILDGLPAQSYVEKGILAELSLLLSEQLPKLQENIVSNYMRGDGLYMLPLRYSIPMIATSGQNAEIFASLAALTAYCEAEEGNEVILPKVPYHDIVELLYYNFPPGIIAADGSVNEENILEFIRLTKRFCEAERGVASEQLASDLFKFQARSRKKNYFSGNTLSGYSEGEQKLSFFNMTGVYGLDTYPEATKLRGGTLLGNKGMFFPNGVIGINARTKKTDFAELFLKAAFSYEMQRVHSSGAGFSLHKEVLAEDAQVDCSHMLINSQLTETNTLHYFSRKDAKQMIQIAGAVQTPVERNEPLFEIIRDEVYTCLCGEQEEQEAVKKIVERVQLYYYE